VKIIGYCHSCNHRHPIDLDPANPGRDAQLVVDWYAKHNGHQGVGLCWPGRTQKPSWVTRLKSWWEFRRFRPRAALAPGHYAAIKKFPLLACVGEAPPALVSMLPNADVKLAYGATATPTFTLASLAASSSLLGGRESTAIDNGASVKYLDYLVSAQYRSDSSNNQAGSIYTCVVSCFDDTPTWPDVFDGTDSAETVSKQGVFNSICRFLSVIAADATASQNWSVTGASVAGCFGGIIPDQFVYFVTHNIQTSTNGWSASSNVFQHTPVYSTVT
jgi:hypothetical protein